jgi:hypothetical protein
MRRDDEDIEHGVSTIRTRGLPLWGNLYSAAAIDSNLDYQTPPVNLPLV